MSEPSQSIPSPGGMLQRGLFIVELLVAAHQPMSLTQIAEKSGIDVSSALRILRVLAKDFYVLREPGSKLYAPGPRALFPLDLHHPLNVYRRSALPLMQSLAESSGMTVAMHLYMYGERVVVDVVQGPKPLTPFYDTHVRRPPHVSAAGKVFLLSLDRQLRAAALGPGPYQRLTEKTICDAPTLEAELSEAERLGYAKSIEEAYPWLSSVAAPIRTRSSTIIGCFIVFGLSESLKTEDIPTLGEKVQRAAEIFTYQCPALDAVERLVAWNSARSERARGMT